MAWIAGRSLDSANQLAKLPTHPALFAPCLAQTLPMALDFALQGATLFLRGVFNQGDDSVHWFCVGFAQVAGCCVLG